jgi:hypothetical protein
MNERIRELYEQARLQAESIDADIDPKGWMDLYHQKFAESIVRECASIVAKRKNQAIDDGWNVDEAMSMAEMDFLEHFGVEDE